MKHEEENGYFLPIDTEKYTITPRTEVEKTPREKYRMEVARLDSLLQADRIQRRLEARKEMIEAMKNPKTLIMKVILLWILNYVVLNPYSLFALYILYISI